MAVATFKPHQRLFIHEELFELTRKLNHTEWQLQHVDTGRLEIKKQKELLALYDQRELQFFIGDKFNESGGAHKEMLPFDMLSDEQQEKAKIRYAYVSEMIAQDVNFSKEQMELVIEKVHNDLGKPLTKPGWSSVYRWVKKYKVGGNDIITLVDRNNRKGNRVRRYDEKLLELVRTAISSIYLSRERPTINDTLYGVIDLVRKENMRLPDGMELPLPTHALVRSEIAKIPAYDCDLARLGPQATLAKYRSSKGANWAERPLQRAEIDHTVFDIMVVDDNSMLPLGRPTLTVCQDVMTRCVLGFYLGFEPPNFSTVSQCLKHSFMPKSNLKKQYPKVEREWDCFGVMETLVVDNGMEFHSINFEALCYSFGINIQYSPRKQAWFKPGIERMIGSINRGVAHTHLGTTFANIFDKGDYDALRNATIKLSTLKEMLNIWVVDIYHQFPHRTLLQQPIKLWRENIGSSFHLPVNPDELDMLTGSIAERVLGHQGVQLNNLFYNSRDLEHLRKKLGSEIKVKVRFIEADLGHIYVVNPESNKPILVPALNKSYAGGISLWQHKVFRKFAKQVLNREDIEGIAKAKATLRELVEQDFAEKKIKTRAKVARIQESKPTLLNQAESKERPEPALSAPLEIESDDYERKELVVEVTSRDIWGAHNE